MGYNTVADIIDLSSLV